MKKLSLKLALSAVFFLLSSLTIIAQTTIAGKISDKADNSPMIGANLSVKGKVIGTIADVNGNFELTTSTPTPFTIIVSSVGYSPIEMIINGSNENMTIEMSETSTLGAEVVVSASRVEESVLKSSVSVETMSIRDIQQTGSANFYDALRNLKGIDMSTQSFSFNSINMRGFGSNGNVRVVQLIDGMDNQAPGLNFSVGNVVGISELDLEKVEVLPGAGSALYGPNAINGLVLMNSKSPFLYQGLSAQVKYGNMKASNRRVESTPFSDLSIRYAKAWNNKFAVKFNLTAQSAQDWEATDYRDQSDGSKLSVGTRTNSLLYNGINIYGDEVSQNLFSNIMGIYNGVNGAAGQILAAGIPAAALPQALPAGLQGAGYPAATAAQLSQFYLGFQQILGAMNQAYAATGQSPINATSLMSRFIPNYSISGPGYKEQDLVDYNNKNIKANLAVHWRINDDIELIIQDNYGQGTSVYTGIDRYSLRNFSLNQFKAELKGANWFLRGYNTTENSGDAYASGTLAQVMLLGTGAYTNYFGNYFLTFAGQSFGTFAQTFLGTYGSTGNPFGALDAATQAAQAGYTTFGNNAFTAAQSAIPAVGSAAFEAAKKQVSETPLPNGAKFLDRTGMTHFEGMYNFTEALNNSIEMIAGANYRTYNLNSQGTLFLTKADGSEYSISEFGGYLQLAKALFEDKFKITGSARYDKNENFKGQFTPRISGVLSLGTSNIRASYQSGFRIPTTQDQYINLLTPSARLLGGLPAVQDKYNLSGNTYTLSSYLAGSPQVYQAKEWKPERIVSSEIGYKGLFANKFLVDAYWYSSTYNNFSAGQQVIDANGQVYSFPANIDGKVKTGGWGLGIDWKFAGNFTIGANFSNNEVKSVEGNDINVRTLGYNTPKMRATYTFANNNIGKSGFGFNIAYRTQDAFVWQSTIVNPVVNQQQQSIIPAFSTLDIAVTKRLPALKTLLKVGGSNLTGNEYTTSWANPTIGRTLFISLTFDEFFR